MPRAAHPPHGVEWEFERVTFSREFSRNVVTKLLVERAEHGGWELDRVRIGPDGTRRVTLRRKIIRASVLRPERSLVTNRTCAR